MQIIAIAVSLAITAVAVGLAVVAVRRMLGVIRLGQPAPGRSDQPGRRWATMLRETLGHTRMLQWSWIGAMHWFVMAGFIFLSSLVFGAYLLIFDAHQAFPIIGHFRIYEWPVEALSWLTLIGIVYLITVRQKNHPRRLARKSRFFGSNFWQAYFVEAVILAVVVLGLALRTIEYAVLNHADYLAAHPDAAEHNGLAHFPTIAWLGQLWGGLSLGTLENLVYFLAMVKIVVSMTWLIVISRNITMGVAWHRFTAWVNIWFKRESDGSTALGAIKPLMSNGKPVSLDDLEDLDEDSSLGVGSVEDFSWKGILDFTTCTECGRCQSQCPAWNTEKPLSPKLFVTAMRDHAYGKAPYLQASSDEARAALPPAALAEAERPLVGDTGDDWFYMPDSGAAVIDEDVLWSCTSCGACVQQCPVDIEHVDHIMDMRRYQVLVEANFPAELNQLFKGLENKGNPWNMSAQARMDWAKDLPFEVKLVGKDLEDLDSVDWLFWVGCAGAYEDRAKKTTRAVAELLDMAGVTFGVLGNGETCTGDPARRAGNEFVFQGLAQQNAETFKEFKVKKVVSTCAHCFNTLKNEYADFGVELEVVHHTQLLNRLVREGKLTPVNDGVGAAKRSITYHDPCYLGRHNQVYSPPRELLQIMPGAEVVEMERNSEKSFCCGAGGARMWMEENIGERINVNRTKEAVGTGADQIAVGCPFCRVMLSDGLTAEQANGNAREEVEVLDVAQMLLASVKGESATRAAPGQKAPAATAAAGTAATAVATQAEPAPADVTQTEETVTATEDVGPAAKASGGSSLFDTPAESTGGSLFDTPAEAEPEPPAPASSSGSLFDTPADSSGGSLFDTPADSSGGSLFDTPAESEPEPSPAPVDSSATDEAEPVSSVGSLFDIGSDEPAAPEAPSASTAAPAEAAPAAEETDAAAEAKAEPAGAPAAEETDLGAGGSLFDIAAPEAPAEPSGDEPAQTTAPSATADPASDIPEGGSLFDISAPEPASSPVEEPSAVEEAAPAEPIEEPAPAPEPSPTTTDGGPAEEVAAARTEEAAAVEETPTSEAEPAEEKSAEPSREPKTGGDIDEAGSLFDL